jgi:hypothetical protein
MSKKLENLQLLLANVHLLIELLNEIDKNICFESQTVENQLLTLHLSSSSLLKEIRREIKRELEIDEGNPN